MGCLVGTGALGLGVAPPAVPGPGVPGSILIVVLAMSVEIVKQIIKLLNIKTALSTAAYALV